LVHRRRVRSFQPDLHSEHRRRRAASRDAGRNFCGRCLARRQIVVAPGTDGRITLFPVDGGTPQVLRGLEPGLRFVQWGADGRSIYVRDDEQPTSVYRADLSTGQKTQVLRLMPSDPSGVVNLQTVVLTPDGKAYAYNYRRLLSELLVVKELK